MKKKTNGTELLSKYNSDLVDLQTKADIIREKRDYLLISQHFEEFKKLEGKYFKFRNGYGGNQKKWWQYLKVKSIKKEDLYVSGEDRVLSYFTGITFEITSLGIAEIQFNHKGYVHSLDSYTEISESEFNKQLKSLIGKLALQQSSR